MFHLSIMFHDVSAVLEGTPHLSLTEAREKVYATHNRNRLLVLRNEALQLVDGLNAELVRRSREEEEATEEAYMRWHHIRDDAPDEDEDAHNFI